MDKYKIKAIIIVEGKKDTQRLRLIDPNVQTIETNGAAINQKVISLIKKVSIQNEVIVFTDPDFSGERIRRLITKAVPKVKQAFLRQKDAIPQKHLRHASL
ncbi:MAG: toprim domain-containing protein, partial [Lactobacillaceae bacterium]